MRLPRHGVKAIRQPNQYRLSVTVRGCIPHAHTHMAVYAIGDLQGCLDPFMRLLDALAYDEHRDRLLLTGDLVNRGPQSLQVLRFVRSLGSSVTTVLGNHDLHLLAVAYGGRAGSRDTLDDVLHAPDRDELLDWLRQRPLAHREPDGTLLVHAGLPPQWDIEMALRCAQEVSATLSGPLAADFLSSMYGNRPDFWDPALEGIERLRYTVNCLTRLRYCTSAGRIDLQHKGAPGSQPPDLLPWFQMPQRRSVGTRILCGHWSTVGRMHWPEENVFTLDSGCVWGGCLTALDLHSGALHTAGCEQYRRPGNAEPD